MRLLLLVIVAGCVSTEPTGPCADALVGEARIELGEVAGGIYDPLESDDTLMVHSGLGGGFHSDLAVRLWGPDAEGDRLGGLTIAAALDAPWSEAATTDLTPLCRDLGEPVILHTERFFYQGPGCGEDVCVDPDDTSPACVAYRECVEQEEMGFPNVLWEELYALTASFEVSVSGGGFEATTAVSPVPLVQGFQVSGGG